MIKRFKSRLKELSDILNLDSNTNKIERRQALIKKQDFLLAKQQYQSRRISTIIKKIQEIGFELSKNISKNNPDNSKVLKILKLIESEDSVTQNLKEIIEIAETIQSKSEDLGLQIKLSVKIPPDIRQDIMADFRELEKCYNSNCLRAATILCGRIMEVCLHRKYFEAVGIDLLEKSPGIGLGKLIAKMSEKNIRLDPGLPQQIHLINQIRIFSVHKKSESFYPSKSQCQAIILYTIDIIEKLF